jgi:ribosomal protein S21
VIPTKTMATHTPPVGLTPSRRPAHAVVAVANGDVQAALKMLKRKLDDSGAWREIRVKTPNSPFGGYLKPGEKKRIKSASARARVRKNRARGRLRRAA